MIHSNRNKQLQWHTKSTYYFSAPDLDNVDDSSNGRQYITPVPVFMMWHFLITLVMGAYQADSIQGSPDHSAY